MSTFEKTSKTFWGAGVFLVCLLAVVDQLAKVMAPKTFRNYKFAFSLPLPNGLMYVIYAVVVGAVIYYCVKHFRQFSTIQRIAWLLIITGALLNVGERLVLGYVRDFIYVYFYRWVGVYNLADFFILGGLGLLLIFPMLTKHFPKQ